MEPVPENIQNPVNEVPSQDDRLLGLFSHLSIFFGSLIIPLIFWAVNKDRSKFVTFHSLQSLFFHIAYTVVLVFVVIFVAIVGMASGLIKPEGQNPSMGAFQVIVILALAVVVLGIVFGAIILAVINAIDSYKGGMKKYPIIGNIVYKKVYGK